MCWHVVSQAHRVGLGNQKLHDVQDVQLIIPTYLNSCQYCDISSPEMDQVLPIQDYY